MLFRLLIAFIVVPLVELFLLLQLAEATSALTTFAVVIVTGIIGSMLARREGIGAWSRFRQALAEGRMPGREIQDGMMIVFAAALLLTPGLLTDGLGFLLLVPAGRDLVRRILIARYANRFNIHVTTFGSGSDFEPLGSDDVGERRRHVRGEDYTIDAASVERR